MCIPPASNCYIVTFIAACSLWKSSNTSYSPSLQSSSFHCATLPLNFSIGSDIWLHFQCANMEGNPWVISSHMVMSLLGVHQLLQWSKMQLLARTPLVWLAFSINAHQSKPIGSTPAHLVQCALLPSKFTSFWIFQGCRFESSCHSGQTLDIKRWCLHWLTQNYGQVPTATEIT